MCYKIVILAIFSLILINCSKSFYLPNVQRNASVTKNDHKNIVEEKQIAVCNIDANGTQAHANASISRELKGVCTSDELNSILSAFQTKLLQELEYIKKLLKSNSDFIQIPTTNPDKAYDSNEFSTINTRKREILQYNDTVDEDVYIYYWQINNIHKLLLKRDMYISSSKFNMFGHTMQLQFYPHHLDSEYVGLQLRPDSNTFMKKYKLVILHCCDQGQDISSPALGDLYSGSMYRFLPQEIQKGYIIEDSLVVKLVLFINS